MLAWIIGLAGIIVSGIGSVFIFTGTPLDTIGNQFTFELYSPEEEAAKQQSLQRRRHRSKIGFGMLAVGFAIQIAAQIFNYPNP